MELDQALRMLQSRIAKLEARVRETVQVGTVSEVKYAPQLLVRLDLAPQGEPAELTEFMPVLQPRAAAGFRAYLPVEIGDRGLVISPAGDPSIGFYLAGLFTASTPPPVQESERDNQIRIDFGGLTAVWDKDSDSLVVSTEKITLMGSVTITDDLRVNGGISAGGDITTDAGISHNSHTHTDTAGLGAGTTTGPQ